MNLNNYVELIALAVALVFYKDLLRHSIFIYFIPFLIITSIVEIAALGMDRPVKNVMYNYFLICQFAFYSFAFYKNLNLHKLRKFILFSFLVFLIFFIGTAFSEGGLHEYQSYTSILTAFFIVIYICMFFYETILPKNSYTKLMTNPFLWVAVGLLFSKLGSVIIFAMFRFLSSIDLQNKGVVVFQTIIKSLNVVLYGSFSVAFILCRNNKKIS